MFSSSILLVVIALLMGLCLLSASAPPAYAYARVQGPYPNGNYPARYYSLR
jgi:hypothetical protein